MSPLVSLIVIAGLCLADATKQPADIMEHLRQEFDALKLAMEMKYKVDIEKLSRQVAKQEANTERCQSDTEKYQADIEKYQVNIERLSRQVAKQEANTERYQADIDILTKQVSQQKEDIEDLKEQNTDLKEMTGVVAFNARVAAFTGSSSQDSPIPFNVVDLNVGNAYNPGNGEFVAPVDGLYSISFEIMADNPCDGGMACGLLYVNGGLFSESCSVFPNSAGTAVTVQLTAGQAVWLAISAGAPCQSLNANLNDNKFSGNLLYTII